MTTTKKEQRLALWTGSLAALSLDSLTKIAAEITVDFKGSDDDKAEYETYVRKEQSKKLVGYILSFRPLYTNRGLFAWLAKGANGWGMTIPGETTVKRKVGRPRKDDTAPRASRMIPMRGTQVQFLLPGDHLNLAKRAGFKRLPSKTGRTELRDSQYFRCTADAKKGLVIVTRESGVNTTVQFLRTRLADNPALLKRVLMVDAHGDVPVLNERVLERASLHRTRSGYRLSA